MNATTTKEDEMTPETAPMHIGIPTDYRSYIAGARDMLHEAAKMFRLTLGPEGHAAMCDAHKLRLELVLRALDKGECIQIATNGKKGE